MKPVFEKTPTGYVAWVDGRPGALTQGDTLGEARQNLGDAVKLVLETRRMIGRWMPPGSGRKRRAWIQRTTIPRTMTILTAR